MASLFLADFNKDTASAAQTSVSVQSLAQRATQNIVARDTERDATVTAEALAVNERLIQTEVFLTGVPLTRTTAAQQALITPTITFTPVTLPTQIMDTGDVLMMLVPDGKFIMGQDGAGNASPAHNVQLLDYYIDQYEVTNMRYQACVNAEACQPAEITSSQTRTTYYKDPGFINYPMLNVNWPMAQAYCEWRGARLPTEAEWEKAARGLKALQYPWGMIRAVSLRITMFAWVIPPAWINIQLAEACMECSTWRAMLRSGRAACSGPIPMIQQTDVKTAAPMNPASCAVDPGPHLPKSC